MKRIFLTYILVLIAVSSGCTSTVTSYNYQLKPDWVSGSSDQFPSKKYLVGVGDSTNHSRAKDKARADLVKTIQIRIDASSNLRERVSSHESDAGITEDIRRISVDDIQTSSQVEMKNIRIEDTWYDDKNERYFALAVLSRSKASFDLTFEIEELDAETARYINRKNKADNPFEKIALMNKAIQTQKKRIVLRNYLVAIDSSPLAITSRYDIDLLYKQLLNIQRKITVSVNVSGADAELLKSYAESGLSAYGYKVVSDNSADFIFFIVLEDKPIFFKDELYWVYANLELKLKNKKEYMAVGICNLNIKEASQFKEQTRRKLLAAVKDIFDNDLKRILNSFISSETCDNSE